MNTILTRITFVGAIYLSILCLIPDVMISGIHLQHLPLIGNFIDKSLPALPAGRSECQFYFGGTSLLIVVGVAMDTINQIEAQLIMRHYEGFTPRAGRIRGRRSSTRWHWLNQALVPRPPWSPLPEAARAGPVRFAGFG